MLRRPGWLCIAVLLFFLCLIDFFGPCLAFAGNDVPGHGLVCCGAGMFGAFGSSLWGPALLLFAAGLLLMFFHR